MEEKQRPIQRLSQEVVGQIAAGEVVERPAAAIKELVENSIDAGATAITVEIREGGISYLRVSDNGKGIPASQIRMAFERHATSKIVRSEDLFDVHTLGFRGEALASIAAVAKVTCTTRTAKEDFGVRAQVEAGQIVDVREAATPVGTTLLVRDLFYNTPVRLKFLKKPAVEATFVSDYMARLILSRPDISFRFVSQGKTVYQSVGDGNIQSALFCVYGKEALGQMKKVQGTESGVVLQGYVGVGELSRGNRQQQSFFVNGRYFRDLGLSRAVESACQGLVMIGKFPVCALYLELPYGQVDVNVHPNKLEVRFQNAPAVEEAVEAMVRGALHGVSLEERLTSGPPKQEGQMPSAQAEQGFVVVPLKAEEEKERGNTPEDEPALKEAIQALKPVVIPPRRDIGDLQETGAPRQVSQVMQSSPIPPPLEPPAPKPEEKQEFLLPEVAPATTLRLIGIAFHTYWLFEAGERLLWVDQHAAHERILYDKLWERYQGEHISQRLLSPQLVHLTAQECALIKELAPVLEEAGFDIQPFDETSVAVHAIPTLFGRNDSPKELLLEALDECQDRRGQMTRERMRKRVMQMACKKAIKAGDQLTDMEIQHLLKAMLETGIMPTCPHGRPIVTEITRRDMEKRFKRIQ